MEVYSIGFTKKTAAQFFDALKTAGIRRLLDVRLNNVSQLSGFAKREDLSYFLRELCGIEYQHEPLLAPTAELLLDYRKKRISWGEYESGFHALMMERRIDERIPRDGFQSPTVLLCSEPTAERCHRRLVLEFLQERWNGLQITHL
jgi:uncharacterized protein (DUF488 family)